MDRVVRMIEFRFDIAAVSKDENSKAFFFDGGETILVSSRQGRVVVEACSDTLMTEVRKEIAMDRERAEKERFANDLAALKLELTVESAGETIRPTGVQSVLGRKFGDALVDPDDPKALPDGSWFASFRGTAAFSGSQDFTAFGTTKTKSIYRVRVFWPDCSDKAQYEHVRRTVELAMRNSMADRGDNSCQFELGNAYVTLVRNVAKNSLSLDFYDKTVYAQHLEESKDLPNDESWRDIDAL